MKLSLCKVHLRMFQYRLDSSQLLMRPNGAKLPSRQGVPSQGHSRWGETQHGVLLVFQNSGFGTFFSIAFSQTDSCLHGIKLDLQSFFFLFRLQVQVLVRSSLCWMGVVRLTLELFLVSVRSFPNDEWVQRPTLKALGHHERRGRHEAATSLCLAKRHHPGMSPC